MTKDDEIQKLKKEVKILYELLKAARLKAQYYARKTKQLQDELSCQ